MVMIACVVLLYFATRFRNVNRESLEILRELKETHTNLQQTLRKAGKGLATARIFLLLKLICKQVLIIGVYPSLSFVLFSP